MATAKALKDLLATPKTIGKIAAAMGVSPAEAREKCSKAKGIKRVKEHGREAYVVG